MPLVKLEINGKRVFADSARTILEVARENGITDIPTLCHDEQLEPFSSCFVCAVKVKGARTLLPACSTKVTCGMVIETNSTEVRRSRKAAIELLLSNHYADCLGPCRLACPAGVDIQGYVGLAALGKFSEAVGLIKERNPLPAICGRVCTRPCEVSGCRRGMLDQAVGIDYIKRYIADLDLGKAQPYRPTVAPPNGKRVAIVGAGPAGLSCAYYLAIKGFSVHLFEAMPEAGGMLRYGIPEYRLPKEVLDLEVNQILDLGVKLSTNAWLGEDYTLASLKQDGFAAVFLGLGAWESASMGVKDENSQGVLSGIEFLRDFGLRKTIALSGTVLVVGGGNTAIDCGRTALRLGASEVKILYRRTRKEMPANRMEIEEAEREGVKMEFLVAPTRVVQQNGQVVAIECLRMELGEPDASGRRSPKPIPGSEFQVGCTTILAAIGQSSKVHELIGGKVSNFLPPGEELKLTRRQTIQTDEKTFATSAEGVFAGGDVVTGAATAVEAIAAGRKAAHAIDRYVATGRVEPEPVEFCSRKDVFAKVTPADLRSSEKMEHRPMPSIPPDERQCSFAEVELGYTADDVKQETKRCLECGCSVLFDCLLRRYATDYQVDIRTFLGVANQYSVDRTHPLIELDPNKCILCGRCVRMCSEVVGVNAFGFVNRGFQTMVRPALLGSLLETDCVSCGLCVETCPTGAISRKPWLIKSGPWATDRVSSTCHFCGVGCELSFDAFGDSLIKVGRCEANPLTAGGHCRKGIFGYEYVQSSDRLLTGRIRPGRELQETTIEEAVSYAAVRMKELLQSSVPEEIAVFVSPRMTNEEIYLAQKLARVVFKTHNVTSFSRLVNPDLFHPEVVSTGTYRDLVDARTLLVVDSNLDQEHFVVDLLTKRAIRKGGQLVVIGPNDNRTSRTAEVFLKCRAGMEPKGLRGLLSLIPDLPGGGIDDRLESGLCLDSLVAESGVELSALQEAARVLSASGSKILVFNKDYRGPRVPGDEQLFALAARALGASLLALREKSNMQGLLDMGADPEWLPGYLPLGDEAVTQALEKEWCVSLRDVRGDPEGLRKALADRRIKLAVVLGEDPLGNTAFPRELKEGLLAAEFLLVGDLFMTSTAQNANVVLPLSSPVETSGTFTNLERRVQRVRPAILPRSGIQTWQILCQLASKLGFRFKMKYGSPDEVLEEIRRVAPIYSEIDPDGDGHKAIWNLETFPLAKPADLDALGGTSEPVATLAFDCLESRFEKRFDRLFEEARQTKARQPTAST